MLWIKLLYLKNRNIIKIMIIIEYIQSGVFYNLKLKIIMEF